MNKTLTDPILAEKFQLYENSDYHFKIKYLSYLVASDSDLSPYEVVKFAPLNQNTFQFPDLTINISLISGFTPNDPILDYLEDFEAGNSELVLKGEMRPVSSNDTEISGSKALNQIYYSYGSDKTIKEHQINFIKKGEMFHFLFGSQPGFFNKYFQDFRKMIESFEITRAINGTDNVLSNDIPSNQFVLNKYARYFPTFTQGSANLTRAYQDEIGIWLLETVSNEMMAELIDKHLVNFTKQTNEFNQTESPSAFESAKISLVNSFNNEIKSYQYFKNCLLTGNETLNEISTNFLSISIEDEAMSFKSFKEVTNKTS